MLRDPAWLSEGMSNNGLKKRLLKIISLCAIVIRTSDESIATVSSKYYPSTGH